MPLAECTSLSSMYITTSLYRSTNGACISIFEDSCASFKGWSVAFLLCMLDSLRLNRHFPSHAHPRGCSNRRLSSSVWLHHMCESLPVASRLRPVAHGCGDRQSRRECFGTSEEVSIGVIFYLGPYVLLTRSSNLLAKTLSEHY